MAGALSAAVGKDDGGNVKAAGCVGDAESVSERAGVESVSVGAFAA